MNSKSEFSRCRVPKLVINFEEWKTKEKSDNAKMTDSEKEAEKEDKELVEELEKVEDAIRRKEGKRKEQTEKVCGRKAKRRKFEKLVNWGRG